MRQLNNWRSTGLCRQHRMSIRAQCLVQDVSAAPLPWFCVPCVWCAGLIGLRDQNLKEVGPCDPSLMMLLMACPAMLPQCAACRCTHTAPGIGRANPRAIRTSQP